MMHDHDHDFDRRGRAEAGRIHREAAGIADTEAALDALLHPAMPLVATARRRPRRLLALALAGGIAAAVAAVVVVSLASGHDSGEPAGVPPTTPPPPVTTGPVTTPPLPVTTAPTSAPRPATTVPTSAPAASRPPDPATVDRLAGWPAAPTSVPSADDVPLLLPAVGVPGADRVERAEHVPSEPAEQVQYVQEWVAPGERPIVLRITTSPYPNLLGLQNSTRVDVAGWDEAYVHTMAPGFGSVVLREPGGSVDVWASGLTQQEVQQIAAGLAARTDGPGWEADLSTGAAAALLAFTDGWASGGPGVRMDWFAADTHLVQFETGVPGWGSVNTVHFGGEPLLVEDVNGVDAVVAPSATRVGIVWEYEPGVTVLVGYQGSVDDALAFVRSLGAVDRATWEAAAEPSTRTGDGCDSMFC